MANEQSSFEKVLEADIKQLAQEIRAQRERPAMKDAGEEELIKEAIRAFPQFEKKPGVPSGGAASSSRPQSPLPAYAQNAPAEVKLEVEYLLDIALRHGIAKALSESQKSPYFVQDALHDTLAGKLYPELKKRGIVK